MKTISELEKLIVRIIPICFLNIVEGKSILNLLKKIGSSFRILLIKLSIWIYLIVKRQLIALMMEKLSALKLIKKILVKFKEKCAELNVSLSVGFLTVYAMLLKELTGNKIIPIGMPFSSRREDGVDMIGLLVNLELICLQIDCRDEFESLVYQTHKQVMHYITKKYPPFVEMCRIFKASREKMKLPHHIVYNYLEEYESLQNNEIVISPITYIDNQVRHDFGLLINNSSSECYGEFTYNTNFLGSDIAEYARDIYLKLLNSIINQ